MEKWIESSSNIVTVVILELRNESNFLWLTNLKGGGFCPFDNLSVWAVFSYVIDPKDSIFQSKLEFDPSLDRKLCWLVLVAQKSYKGNNKKSWWLGYDISSFYPLFLRW